MRGDSYQPGRLGIFFLRGIFKGVDLVGVPRVGDLGGPRLDARGVDGGGPVSIAGEGRRVLDEVDEDMCIEGYDAGRKEGNRR